MSTKIRFRKGEIVPITEVLSVGEPIWSVQNARLGIGNGEQQPRWYPSIDVNGNMICAPGTDIISPASRAFLSSVICDSNWQSIDFNVNANGNAALSVTNILGGLIRRGGTPSVPFSDTLPTASAIINAVGGPGTGLGVLNTSTEFRYTNLTSETATLLAGTGIILALGGVFTIPPGASYIYKLYMPSLSNLTLISANI
jgi:hypothetical protein